MRVINKVPKQEILINGYDKFQYKTYHKVLTYLFFPLVYGYSKKYQKQFFKFCFDFPKQGKITINNQTINLNSFEYHYYDCQIKDLGRYGYPINFHNENYEEFTIKNQHGRKISCLQILQKTPSNKWVIGFHGWTENKYLALRLVSWFYKQGYNVLTFDSMGHGKSYGTYTDVGLTTAQDVNYLIKWLKSKHDVATIGLIGNSMGASTINYYLFNYAKVQMINWAITDCGFTCLINQFHFVMQYRFKRPWWLMSYNLAKNYEKLTKTDIRKYDFLNDSKQGFKVPTLLIHGKSDLLVPFFMANEIDKHQINNQNYEALFLDNIDHVATLTDAYEQYVTALSNFIKKYESLKS